MTTTILRVWPVAEGLEVRLVGNDAWNLDARDSEYRYAVVTVRDGVETDEAVCDDPDEAMIEGRIRARVLAEDCEG
jgi:hypothetical protein